MKPSQEERDQLNHLSKILARIHKGLFEAKMLEREKREGTVLGPGARLQLLIHDEEFAWLRPLSQLMTAVDDVYFQKEPISIEQMSSLKSEIKDLLIEMKKAEFAVPFSGICKTLPGVVLEHGNLVAALRGP